MAADKALAEKNEELEAKARDTVDRLNKLYEQAGRDVLAADFAGNASSEDTSFKNLSKIASAAFLAAAVILALMWANLSLGEGFKFSDLFQRLPISIVILLPAFYFASLASGHRKASLKLRSLGLRIKAFDAYLINAQVKDVEDLKREMAKEFFEEKPEDGPKGSLFSRNQGDNFDRLADLADKVADKVPNVND